MKAIDFQSIIEEYREKWSLYHDFCVTMKNLLVYLLVDKKYKYQISYRIKSLDSLTEKIAKKNEEGKNYKKLSDIDDLAGIRIVFYLESDKKRFVSDLFKEFTSQKLTLEERHKKKGYRATHVRAKFGRKRLILGEYKRFKGLKCEIQLTSALYHAWSEIEHDLFYKPNVKIDKGKREALLKLKRDLQKTMTNHIEKASDLFEFVANRVHEINVKEKIS